MTKSQVNLIARSFMALFALLFAGMSTQAYAQTPGPHPAYLHALRDLREARDLLHSDFADARHKELGAAATQEVEKAIGDLKAASHLDEKNLGDTPPTKALSPEGRFHQIQALLSSAHNDIKQPESDPVARPYKDRALGHIDSALKIIQPAV